MPPVLDDVALRLSHARSQYNRLAQASAEFLDSIEGQMRLEQSYIADERRLSARIAAPEPPRELGLLAGDVLHSWRASLDNLIHVMLARNAWPPSERHQFPIEDVDNSKGRRSFTDKTAGLHPDDVSAIKAVQPWNLDEDAAGHPLACLRDLSNHDKHHVIISTVHAWGLRIKADQGWQPVADRRLLPRGVKFEMNFWLHGVTGGEIETMDMPIPQPNGDVLSLILKNVTHAQPRMERNAIETELVFWSPKNWANFARLSQIDDYLMAMLTETERRWARTE